MGPHSFVTKVFIKKGNSFVSKVCLFYIFVAFYVTWLVVGRGGVCGLDSVVKNTIQYCIGCSLGNFDSFGHIYVSSCILQLLSCIYIKTQSSWQRTYFLRTIFLEISPGAYRLISHFMLMSR